MVYRAKTNCPDCNNEQEVWFTHILDQKEQPDYVDCINCNTSYNTKQFVSKFINLKDNNSISSKYSIANIT